LLARVTIATLPVAQFPKHRSTGKFSYRATYPGADAKTLEQAVATPIEQQINGVDNMDYMYSLKRHCQLANYNGRGLRRKDGPNTDLILAQSREQLATGQLPPRLTPLGHYQKVSDRSAHADLLVRAAWHSRCEVPGQLCLHQPQ